MASILFRIKGTVILKTWRKIVLVVLYTTGVICTERFVLGWKEDSVLDDDRKEITSIIVMFGLFTGFLLVFRTNTAYDRYWEGRKLWSTVILNIRILTRVIWTTVPYDRLSFWRSAFEIKRKQTKSKKSFRVKRRACSTSCVTKRSPRAKPMIKFAKHTHASVRRTSIISRASKVGPVKTHSSVDSLGDLYETDSSIECSRSPSPSSSHYSSYSTEFLSENDDLFKTEKSVPQSYSKDSTNKLVIEQISAINLLVAFAYATRNFLRGNHSYTEHNLRKLIKHVPHFQEEIEKERLSKRLKRMSSSSRNIPIEISHLIMSYIKNLREQDLVDDPTANILNIALNSLVECLAQFEKILKTPIPLAYSKHLHHAIWLYFLATPYQLIELLNWWTIPVLGLVAFAILGILDIGVEIENPFGFDDNDLTMDLFCQAIHQETLNVIGNPMPPAETWIFSKFNFPLVSESVSAKQLIKLTESDMRDILTWCGSPKGNKSQ